MQRLHLTLASLATLATLAIGMSVRADEPRHRRLTTVPFTAVKIGDQFWAPRLATNREKSLPHNFKWCEQTGRFANFAKAGGLAKGKFEGIYFNDSDVYKVLEGAAYSLADHPDAVLEAQVDAVIAKIAAAQQSNGYLNTFYTLVEPDKKWTNCRVRHELYCAGHLIEGAVAHFRATGKRSLLDVALKFVDRIDAIFGPGKRHDVPGHEEIELALVKLFEVTKDRRHLELAKFFLDVRGDSSKRKLYGEYCQDHRPVREQREIVGHAVRAMYLYSGVADVAAYTGDAGLLEAMRHLWDDVVVRKMYITGGIGARRHGESFGAAYELPNAQAYAETCAAIGLALWAHRLNLLSGDARYVDVLERVLYNGILSGIGLGGERFFYVNPLASGGGHHRQPFFSCACCPSNVVRFVPSLPGYVYARDDDGILVNLYVAGIAKIRLGNSRVRIEQQTDYPWSGKVRLAVRMDQPRTFALRLRIPSWCDDARLSVAGKPLEKLQSEQGYVRLVREWKDGDIVELELPMKIRRMEAHPLVKANAGRVALQRGPIVYCFEGTDNEGQVQNIVLPREPKFRAKHRRDLLGGVTVIEGIDRRGRGIVALPYYAWDHREPGPMTVWVRQDGKPKKPASPGPDWRGRLYRALDPARLGPSTPFSPDELTVVTASHSHDNIEAVRDRVEPKNSGDHDIPRFTWWNHRGTREWIQYDFGEARRVSSVKVYWFDDARLNRHCRVPKSWRLLYREGKKWKPVSNNSKYGLAADAYNRVTFAPVETTAVRLEVVLKPNFSGGVLEWKVE